MCLENHLEPASAQIAHLATSFLAPLASHKIQQRHVCSLLQWCHGAPGMTQLLAEASKPRWQGLFGEDLQLMARDTAAKVADTIWERGLLVKVHP